MPQLTDVPKVIAHLREAFEEDRYLFLTDDLAAHEAFADLALRLAARKVRGAALNFGYLPCVSAEGHRFDLSFLTVKRSGPAYHEVTRFAKNLRGQSPDAKPGVFVIAADPEKVGYVLADIVEGTVRMCVADPSAN